MGIRLSEHHTFYIYNQDSEKDSLQDQNSLYVEESVFSAYGTIVSKSFNKSSHRFIFEKKESSYEIKADYCIGIDWLGSTGRYLYVEPKINYKNIEYFINQFDDELKTDKNVNSNNKSYELDYLKMLLDITSVVESNNEIGGLVQIDWDSKRIEIEQKDDQLTPFLIIRFLQILKSVVRKGLKKDYYKVTENIQNRVKGKILVGNHIKQNVFKNRMTSTFCEYQVFGEDHLENRFLKKVLYFVTCYVHNHKALLAKNYYAVQETIDYCNPAFKMISDKIKENELKHIKHNPFFRDYKDAIETGSYILKRFAYNITLTTERKISTPPFWIDMPRLFELYVFIKLLVDNPLYKSKVHYQFKTYGNALDILVSHPDFSMVIDAKYKLHYKKSHLHNDIRQVAGYARLKKVREKLNIDDDRNVDCLIIYPDMENGLDEFSLENIIQDREEIRAYYNVFKIGVKLPFI
nr:restriction endonuclease [uncultured Chryseobacterium sp.]